MLIGLRPSRFTTPFERVRIDPTHPVALGLIAVAIPGQEVDLAGNGVFAGRQSSDPTSVNGRGMGLASIGYPGAPLHPYIDGHSAAVTYIGSIVPGALGNGTELIGISYQEGQPYDSLGIKLTDSNSANFRMVVGTYAQGNQVSGPDVPLAGVTAATAAFTGSDSMGRFYTNGTVASATNFGGDSLNLSGTAGVFLVGSGQNAVCNMAMVHSPAPAPDTIAALHAEPFAFLLPDPERRYYYSIATQAAAVARSLLFGVAG